jgi:hypothetical protein
MSLNVSSTAATRREVVDRLRTSREIDLSLEVDDRQVQALLEEIGLLEIVAGAAWRAGPARPRRASRTRGCPGPSHSSRPGR